MEDVLSLKANSRGKEFLEQRRHRIWYTYVEPVVTFVAFGIFLALIGMMAGATIVVGGAGGLWALGRIMGI